MSCLKVRSDKPKGVDRENEDDVHARPPLPYHFEKELIEKQNRHIRTNDKFIPAIKAHHLERKFYARHEQNLPSYEQYVAQKELALSSRTLNGLPRLESQVYGWLPPCLRSRSVSTLRQLNFVTAPKQRCPMTVQGEKLVGERITERPAFNGLRFVL